MNTPLRILVVTKNSVTIQNIREWYADDITSGRLVVDHAEDKKDARELMEAAQYKKIFHNGTYIIDAIEDLQEGAEVIHAGENKNKIYGKTVNVNSKKSFDRAMWNMDSKIDLKLVLTALTLFVGLIVYVVRMEGAVVNNTDSIKRVDAKIEKQSVQVQEIHDAVVIMSGKKPVNALRTD